MNSMTGFGEAEKKTSFGLIKIEVKSLNHKFKDFVFNLPQGFSFLEGGLKERLNRIKRGRINFSLQILPQVKRKVLVNRGFLKEYLEKIREIKACLPAGRDFDLKLTLDLNTIISIPGIFYIIEEKKEKNFASINLLAKKAIENLISSRKREGEKIYKDLKKRIGIVENLSKNVKERQGVFLKEKKDTFAKSEDWKIFLKNTDITEELTRVDFHSKNFKKIAEIKSRAIGKELDFISQELIREANTMAAKSTCKEIIFNLIRMKAEIERIREQLQNVE